MTAVELLRNSGLLKTFWGKRIADAEERRYFSSEDRELARDWVTCACGKRKDIVRLKSNDFSVPKNLRVRKLGLAFYDMVVLNYYFEAAATLVAIEKVAVELSRKAACNV